ncbi:MAG: insulinase family protein [Gemmatimonadota bacterium]|nr:insulinase family protein [Gemmatimonadota bacterium]
MTILVNTTIKIVLFLIVCTLPAAARIPNHRMYYRHDDRAPITNLEIVFLGAGSNQEDHSKTGLATIVSKLIRNYSKKHGFTARLESLGTQLEVRTYFPYQTVSVSALSPNFEASVGIVNDLIRNMAFADSVIDDAKKELQTSYEKAAAFGSHRLVRNFALARTMGLNRIFSRESMKRITLEDIRQYHDRLLTTEVVFFKAISDLDSMAIARSLLPFTEFRQKGGFVRSPQARKPGGHPGHSAFVVDYYSHLKNVYSYWLIPCGTAGEDEFVPSIISTTLGTGPVSGLLYSYLRQECGLVYSTSCSFRKSDDVRYLEIFADPRLENSETLTEKLADYVIGLADNPRFWETIAELRENPDFANADSHEDLTPRRDLDNEVDIAIYDYPNREGGIKSVTDAEIRSFLERYFVEQNMVMLFYGPKDKITEILEKHWPEVEIHVLTTESTIE